jgi:hypothetical protein
MREDWGAFALRIHSCSFLRSAWECQFWMLPRPLPQERHMLRFDAERRNENAALGYAGSDIEIVHPAPSLFEA